MGLRITKLTVTPCNEANKMDLVTMKFAHGVIVNALMHKRETGKLFRAFDDSRQMEFEFEAG